MTTDYTEANTVFGRNRSELIAHCKLTERGEVGREEERERGTGKEIGREGRRRERGRVYPW